MSVIDHSLEVFNTAQVEIIDDDEISHMPSSQNSEADVIDGTSTTMSVTDEISSELRERSGTQWVMIWRGIDPCVTHMFGAHNIYVEYVIPSPMFFS